MPPISLDVVTGEAIPSFKNTKRSILDKNTGLQRTLTPGKIKRQMQRLENAILSALYSESQTIGGATDLECLRQLRTALSGLSDDSLREIPEFSFGIQYVAKGNEGVLITISEI